MCLLSQALHSLYKIWRGKHVVPVCLPAYLPICMSGSRFIGRFLRGSLRIRLYWQGWSPKNEHILGRQCTSQSIWYRLAENLISYHWGRQAAKGADGYRPVRSGSMSVFPLIRYSFLACSYTRHPTIQQVHDFSERSARWADVGSHYATV